MTRRLAWSAAALLLGAVPASAGEFSLELNALQPSEAGCRVTFMVSNGLGHDIERAAFEIVLFDRNGLVDRLTLIDFKDLPEGKTKVRQFDLAGSDCAGIGRILVNEVAECSGGGINAEACARGLATKTRSGIAFGS